jgi:cell division septal protein FtsQ
VNLPRHHLLGRLLTLLHSGRARLGNFQRGRRRPVPRGSHVLDVLVKSSRQEKLERARRWKRGLQWGAVVTAVVVLATTSHQAVARYFWQNPEFRLATGADIRTNGTLSHDDILRRAGLSDSTHIYDVDLRAVRERLEALPNVRRASVARELPGRLIIEVEERLPLMWLSCDQPSLQPITTNPAHGACLLDEEGHLFLCTELRAELMHLPVLHLRHLANSQPGIQLTSAPVRAGLDLLHRLRATFSPRGLDVSEIDAPNDWSFVAKLSNDLSITFGYEDFDGQLARLTQVMDQSDALNRRLRTVNLLPQKNVAVTFLSEGDQPALADGTAAPGAAAGTALPVSGAPAPQRPPVPSREARQLEAILGSGR